MVAELLESRKLYSVTAVQHGSTLVVTGTDANDTITVTESTVPIISEGDPNPFNLPAGTPIVFVQSDPGGDGQDVETLTAANGDPFFQGVKRVRIVGKGGDDSLQFSGNDVSATIQGDAGDDTINVADDLDGNGIGSSVIFGGAGNDDIEISSGNQTRAFGGAGDDTLIAQLGSTGSAILFGQADNDFFSVSGNVIAIGGSGTDTRDPADTDTQAIVLL